MPQGLRQVKQNRAQYRESSRYCARIPRHSSCE